MNDIPVRIGCVLQMYMKYLSVMHTYAKSIKNLHISEIPNIGQDHLILAITEILKS